MAFSEVPVKQLLTHCYQATCGSFPVCRRHDIWRLPPILLHTDCWAGMSERRLHHLLRSCQRIGHLGGVIVVVLGREEA